MASGLKKADLQAIAEAKIRDADVLLRSGSYSNAYYLAGYSVEIAFKAVIAGRMAHETIPDLAFIKAIYQHGLKELAGVAGLTGELNDRADNDPEFGANWGITAQWKPETRYLSVDAISAQMLLAAILNKDHGVLPWIKTFW